MALHAAGAELGCRAGTSGTPSAGRGLRSAPGLLAPSQFSPASIPAPPGEGLSGHFSSRPGLGWLTGGGGGRWPEGLGRSREEAWPTDGLAGRPSGREAGPRAAAHRRLRCGRRGAAGGAGRPAAGRGCSRPASRPSALLQPAPPASWAHLEMFDLIECRFTLQK